MANAITKTALKELSEEELFTKAKEHGWNKEQDDSTTAEMIDFIYDAANAPKKQKLRQETTRRGGKLYPHFSGKRKLIIIAEGQNKADPRYVYVGINGDYEAQIPRGVEVSVPEEVVESLLTGTAQEVPETDREGRFIRMKKVPRFSIQVLGDADPTPGSKAVGAQ